MVSLLNQARSLAITKLTDYKVFFDINNREFVLRDAQDTDIESHPLETGIFIDRTTFDNDTVIFNSTGSLHGLTRKIFIKDNKDKFYTIKVESTTGRIKVLNYEDT